MCKAASSRCHWSLGKVPAESRKLSTHLGCLIWVCAWAVIWEKVSHSTSAVLCCAVLCCAVPCCAVLVCSDRKVSSRLDCLCMFWVLLLSPVLVHQSRLQKAKVLQAQTDVGHVRTPCRDASVMCCAFTCWLDGSPPFHSFQPLQNTKKHCSPPAFDVL